MARVTHVKAAQQRYKTVPVLDDDGNPKRTAVMRRDGITPKTTKNGRPITRAVTREDKTQPLPPSRCDFPGCQITDQKILPGQPYKWVRPKSGPYGGAKRSRHAEHPSWQPWELSNALWARIAQIQDGASSSIADAESEDDVTSALTSAAEEIRELAEEKREGASNIVDGFGHDTEQSMELEETADSLEGWADDLENWSPSASEPDSCEGCNGAGTVQCQECGGQGAVDCDECDGQTYVMKGAGPCPSCEGEGTTQCEECEGETVVDCEDCDGSGDPSDADVEAWLEDLRSEAEDALNESPL